MEFSSTRALTIRWIEGGILGNLTDMDPRMMPFEAGIGRFVNMERSNFIVLSVLAGKDRRSCLFGLTCAAEITAAGSAVLNGERVVGRITAGVPFPTLGLGIGYVVFKEPSDWAGRTLRMRLTDGKLHVGEIVDLPFFDREKKIVRGIDRSIPKRPEA